MFFSQATTWFIITAATVLHTAHVTTINTAADAARDLEPLVRTFPIRAISPRGCSPWTSSPWRCSRSP